MNPVYVSILALVISIISLIFTIWSRRQVTKVQVAEKLTRAKLAITNLVVTIENQLVSLEMASKSSKSDSRIVRFERLLEKSEKARTKLNSAEWPANSSSLVKLEDITADILEALKETEALINSMRTSSEAAREQT